MAQRARDRSAPTASPNARLFSSSRSSPSSRRLGALRNGTNIASDGQQRVVIERVLPEIDGGRFPIKRTVGESVRVTAWIHADGHDVLAAVLRYRAVLNHQEADGWREATLQPLANDEWSAAFDIDVLHPYEYTVEAWVDRFATWRKELAAKVGASQDVTSELVEGTALLVAMADRAKGSSAEHRSEEDAAWLVERANYLAGSAEPIDRAHAALDDRLATVAARYSDRTHGSMYRRVLTVSVDRERARFGAWYEVFPRSWGPDTTRSATFREAEAHLRAVAEMGFDVVYLPPVHPIGSTFRKGRGNALRAGVGDPGSPWAIGSEAGGHKAVHPELGTLDDFDHFVAEAHCLGLEIALDLAYQCSPDHPYVREHPEWFRHRPDGTIKYAENPPKKYQDIYPFDFECEAWPALWQELKSIVEFWIAHGVGIFRVDNPHTKPYPFWEWLIGDIRNESPNVIFLAEAFTRPKRMYYLAKLGFTQSYTYFTWRNTKEELTEYFTELTRTEVAEYFRPNLFANTPDILHEYLQQGGAPAFQIRLILAATLGATYGIYSGFELCENRAVPGSEEYLDSEKYQYRAWDRDRPGHIRDLVTRVNRLRREHPALQSNEGLMFCPTDNPNLIAIAKRSVDGSDGVLVVVNLDHQNVQHGWIQVPAGALGLPRGEYQVVDQMDGSRYTWRGEWNYVRLDPRVSVAHILDLPLALPPMVTATAEALDTFLPRQRWFGGKARTIQQARLLDWTAKGLRPEVVVPAVASVEYADHSAERYFVPVTAAPAAALASPQPGEIARLDGIVLIDAFHDDGACRALLSMMLSGDSMPLRCGSIRATAFGLEDTKDARDKGGKGGKGGRGRNGGRGGRGGNGGKGRKGGKTKTDTEAAALPITRSGAEQSNSSLVFGDRYVLKLLRRLESGPNPDVEISRFLSQRRFPGIPRLAAMLEYRRNGEEPSAVAMVQEFVANNGTGWDLALRSVRALLAEEAPPATDAADFSRASTTLGRRTAELHLALASDAADPAFAPAALTTEHLSEVIVQLQADAARCLAILTDRAPLLPAAAAEEVQKLLGARERLATMIASLAEWQPDALRTRVHGDYHLGQVLALDDDFVILDFEGEPARPLHERRAKQSPLKDVAGMIRSFSYAAHAALLMDGGVPLERIERSLPSVRAWEQTMVKAFLSAYRGAISQSRIVPGDDLSFSRLLNLFILEKAIYELNYELANRPHWIGIPLAGILEIVKIRN